MAGTPFSALFLSKRYLLLRQKTEYSFLKKVNECHLGRNFHLDMGVGGISLKESDFSVDYNESHQLKKVCACTQSFFSTLFLTVCWWVRITRYSIRVCNTKEKSNIQTEKEKNQGMALFFPLLSLTASPTPVLINGFLNSFFF